MNYCMTVGRHGRRNLVSFVHVLVTTAVYQAVKCQCEGVVTNLDPFSLVWSGETRGSTQSWGHPLTRGELHLSVLFTTLLQKCTSPCLKVVPVTVLR